MARGIPGTITHQPSGLLARRAQALHTLAAEMGTDTIKANDAEAWAALRPKAWPGIRTDDWRRPGERRIA